MTNQQPKPIVIVYMQMLDWLRILRLFVINVMLLYQDIVHDIVVVLFVYVCVPALYFISLSLSGSLCFNTLCNVVHVDCAGYKSPPAQSLFAWFWYIIILLFCCALSLSPTRSLSSSSSSSHDNSTRRRHAHNHRGTIAQRQRQRWRPGSTLRCRRRRRRRDGQPLRRHIRRRLSV